MTTHMWRTTTTATLAGEGLEETQSARKKTVYLRLTQALITPMAMLVKVKTKMHPRLTTACLNMAPSTVINNNIVFIPNITVFKRCN